MQAIVFSACFCFPFAVTHVQKGTPKRTAARFALGSYFLFRRGRRRVRETFGFGFAFLRARASGVGSVRDGGTVGDGFGLFGRRVSNGVSIRMSRSNVCIGMLGGFGIKGVC